MVGGGHEGKGRNAKVLACVALVRKEEEGEMGRTGEEGDIGQKVEGGRAEERGGGVVRSHPMTNHVKCSRFRQGYPVKPLTRVGSV